MEEEWAEEEPESLPAKNADRKSHGADVEDCTGEKEGEELEET